MDTTPWWYRLDALWHMRGSFLVSEADSAVLDRVAAGLRKQCKTVTDRGPEHIAFDDPLFSKVFTPNWLALVIYDRGRFWIERTAEGRLLRYDLRSLHGFLFCLVAPALSILSIGVGNDPGDGLAFAVFAFCWLYGMNILLALFRVPAFIRQAVLKG